MESQPFRVVNPDRYDIATEVMSSAVRILQSAGFNEDEIPKLFDQVAKKRSRAPLYLDPLTS
jgi:hypothetical protein